MLLTITFSSRDIGSTKIKPHLFWSFSTIINGSIPGHVPFHVHGHVVLSDGVLYFDGESDYLSAQQKSTDILVDPTTAIQGLAFGIKLKMEGAMKFFDTPRFVMDTGATSSKTTGVSLYILNGKLIAEVATSTKKWKVRF